MSRRPFAKTVLMLVVVTLTATSVLLAADLRVFANGKPVASDVPPALIGGTTYLPLRATAEALGVKLEWDPKTKTAVLCGMSTCYPIKTADPASGAKVVKGRVLLPLRKAARALGAKVTWGASAKRVDVTR